VAGRYVTLRELVLGYEGLAVLRGLVDANDADQAARLHEIARIATEEGEPWSLGLDIPELDALSGYAQWSQTYDTQENLLINAEQPVVEGICAAVAPGRALDAACGTGRHAKHLAARHDVTGVDQSAEMLAIATQAVPDATFREGELTSLPFDEGAFDLVVCSLALTHLTDLAAGIAELSRVTKPAGRVVCSDIHPMSVLVLGQGFFTNPDGQTAFVRNHVHLHSSYLEAFSKAGLRVLSCVEPLVDTERFGGPAAMFAPEACWAALKDLPIALVWELEKG
jgi:ubiquinone/menaquinone biosynthesis C-methylase UbiE